MAIKSSNSLEVFFSPMATEGYNISLYSMTFGTPVRDFAKI